MVMSYARYFKILDSLYLKIPYEETFVFMIR